MLLLNHCTLTEEKFKKIMKKIRIIHAIVLLLVGGLMSCNNTGRNETERPNIILIMADDMGYDWLS